MILAAHCSGSSIASPSGAALFARGFARATPRVICVAESYNKFGTDTADLLPINIELYRYKLYEDGLQTLDTENYQKVKLQDVQKFTVDSGKAEMLQETFTLDYHLAMASGEAEARTIYLS